MTHEQLECAKTFSGKNAGICYQKETYYGSAVSDPVKASERFPRVIGTAHHSIADHVKIEVLFENCSKMLAIVLNSLQDYSTCEKSGRYTVMHSEDEQELYDKWLEIFKTRLAEELPDIIEPQRTKLAQENARYVLSVFTRSTTMGYTTSLRQWNYIYDWCEVYIKKYESRDEGLVTVFEKELLADFTMLRDFIERTMYVEGMRDLKSRCFDFLTNLSGVAYHPMISFSSRHDTYYGLSYCTSYLASFVHIAQAERHRTIKYFSRINLEPDTLEFFVPDLLLGSSLKGEWLNDLKQRAKQGVLPQATLIEVIELGTLDAFSLKRKERLCGRAQLEIMRQTMATAEKFRLSSDEDFCSQAKFAYLSQFIDFENGHIKKKCEMLGSCKEPCAFKDLESRIV